MEERGLEHPLGWEPDGHRTLAVDFDGVIHSYTTPWVGADVIPDKPVPGAIEWLYVMAMRFRVVIFSTRATTPEGVEAVKDWLSEWGYHGPIHVTAVKPAAIMYVDDRAFHFDGTRFPSAADIDRFEPWNKKPMGVRGQS